MWLSVGRLKRAVCEAHRTLGVEASVFERRVSGVCGVGAARQLVPSVVASRQKHVTRGIELILFFDV